MISYLLPRLLAFLALSFLVACDSGTTSNGQQTASGKSTVSATPVAYDIKDDLQFINMMVPHHQLAIDMARLVDSRAEHGELKGLAKDIIRAQLDEINRMSIWRAELGGVAPTAMTSSNGMADQPGMQMGGMDVDLKKLETSSDFDHDFIKAMIPHHQSAIDMSKSALPNLKRAEVKDLANDIITTQQVEIDRMNGWLKAWK